MKEHKRTWKLSEEQKDAHRQAMNAYFLKPGSRQPYIDAAIKRGQNPEYRALQSEAQKLSWENPIIRNKRVAKMAQALCARPNKTEAKLQSIIDAIRLPYRYTGDGQIVIGGNVPDFANVDGKKKLIEVFGVHWHKVFDVARKIEHYRAYGFDCLIIWEDELADVEKLKRKLIKFNRRRRQSNV